MASTILLPDGMRPSNLHLAPTTKQRFIENDVFHVADRLRDIDPSLNIVQLEGHKGKDVQWLVTEECRDGVVRPVGHFDACDNRMVQKVMFVMSVPFSERLRLLEAENEKFEAETRERESDELYERLGAPMLRQLDRDGFVAGGRGTSYAKRGVSQPGRHG